jgi:hypothetical protein
MLVMRMICEDILISRWGAGPVRRRGMRAPAARPECETGRVAGIEIVPSPGAWHPPLGTRPAWNWIPPDHGLRPRSTACRVGFGSGSGPPSSTASRTCGCGATAGTSARPSSAGPMRVASRNRLSPSQNRLSPSPRRQGCTCRVNSRKTERPTLPRSSCGYQLAAGWRRSCPHAQYVSSLVSHPVAL